MRKQQQIWHNEHLEQTTLPTMANSEPASGVRLFVDWLSTNKIATTGKAVDIGCGKGRNSIYLAEVGYECWALDYIETAIFCAKKLAECKQVQDHIHFVHTAVDIPWQFENDFFDVAVDSFTSIDIETLHGRFICRDELYRTLKPGGYALICVVSCHDEWEQKLIASSPGSEPHSTYWPQNGKFQKNYDEAELRAFYSKFKIVHFQTIQKPAFKLGIDGIATNFL
ncbi:MAG: class I SAM-dependent methyltransferase, partial [Verrucomicrobia bacterium]|nr:class I SAM-dependent methyltransferase [Verrucomicrobiota bacterium]